MNDVTIIIPAHNEQDNIKDIIKYCQAYVPEAHIIVVCDHCTDNTRIYAQMYDGVKVIVLDGDMIGGFKDALIYGVSCASTKYCVFVMADGCDELMILPDMRHKLKTGFDVVCGSRHMIGGRVYKPDSSDKHLASWFVSFLACILVGVRTWDATNAYKMWRTDLLKKVIKANPLKGGFECNMEWLFTAHFNGAKITEFPTIWRGREKGKSSFKFIRQAPAYGWLLLKGVVLRIKRGVKACINGGVL